MTRVEMLRAARGSAHVTFAEYFKIRSAGVPVLVFEGSNARLFTLTK